MRARAAALSLFLRLVREGVPEPDIDLILRRAVATFRSF